MKMNKTKLLLSLKYVFEILIFSFATLGVECFWKEIVPTFHLLVKYLSLFIVLSIGIKLYLMKDKGLNKPSKKVFYLLYYIMLLIISIVAMFIAVGIKSVLFPSCSDYIAAVIGMVLAWFIAFVVEYIRSKSGKKSAHNN